jgi:hypothetical protein
MHAVVLQPQQHFQLVVNMPAAENMASASRRLRGVQRISGCADILYC